VVISNGARIRIKKLGEPFALALGRLGLTPDGLTLVGFGITALGAVLLAGQLWLAGGVVIFAGGVFDMFDGTLARATGRVSRLGAFMDSVFDRWGEALVYLGVIIGCSRAGFGDGPWLAGAAMASAFLVSYVRAKSEGLGFTAGTGMAAIGLMPREVRLVVLTVGLVLAGAAGGVSSALDTPGSTFLAAALAIIAVGATITVIQRVLHVRGQAAAEARERPS
jgi:CDP-diacylglycerol--glycerol-3-phosphate 3-phosphatidyltransferase